MAFVPRSGGTRLVQVHAVSAGYPFYGNIVTDPAAAWGQIQRRRVGHRRSRAARVARRTARRHAVARLGEVRHHGIAAQRARRRRDLGGDRAARLHPRALRSGDGPRRLRQPRRLRDAVQASDRAHERRVREGLRQASLGGQRLGAERGLQRVAARQRDRPAARLSRHRRAHRAPARRHRRGERRARVRDAQDRPRRDSPLRGRDELAGARHLHDAGRGDGSRRRGGGRRCSDSASSSRCRYVLHDFLPVDVDLHLAPRPILLGLAIGVWVALLFAMRPLVALRRVSPLQALRREPDADALRRARWDPLRIALSLAIAASVLALGLSRANTPRRGVGFTLAIAGAIGILWLSAARAVVGGAAIDSSVVAVPAAPGDREPLSPGQSDARRRARARLRRVPHGHAVPGAVQHSSVARPAPRRSARQRRVLRRAGESAGGHRFGHPRGARGADRRDADRRRCESRRSTARSATAIADEIDKNRRVRDSARIAAGRWTRRPRRARRSRARSPRAVGLSARVPLDLPRFADRVGAARVAASGSALRAEARARSARCRSTRASPRDGRQAAATRSPGTCRACSFRRS